MVSTALSRYLYQVQIGLFHFLVLAVPFFFTWVNEELFEFPKIILTYSLTLLILGTWLARMIAEKRLIFRRTPLDIPIIIFVISQVLATLFSIHPYTSWFGYYTRFHGGLLSSLTYVTLFYAFVSNFNKKQLPAFFGSILVAGIGVSLYAIPEHFGHSPSCLLINQNHAFDVSCWIQDVKNRVFGTFGQPNWLAAYAITLILWAAGIIGWSFDITTIKSLIHRQGLRFLAAASIVTLFLTLLYTQSRSGLLGLLVGGSFFGLGSIWMIASYIRQKTFAQHQKLVIWLVALAALGLGLFITNGNAITQNLWPSSFSFVTAPTPSPTSTNPSTISEPLVPINRLEGGITDSGDIRKIVWQGAIDVWHRYPLFGSGVETFAYSYYLDRPLEHNLVSEWDFLYNKAHNEFLNYLATTGIVGFLAYCGLLLAIAGLGGFYFMKTTTSEGDRWLIIGTVTGIIALSVSNFFGFSTVMVTILMYLLPAALIVSLRETYPRLSPAISRQFGARTPEFSSINTSQWLLLGTLSLLLLYGLFMIYSWWRADYTYAAGKQYFAAGYYTEGLTLLQNAVLQSPHEALYYDELATAYAQLAAGLYQQGDATTAAQLTEAALLTSDQALKLNHRHLNFLRSRARVYITLGLVDPAYLPLAQEALENALQLAPTEAKLVYNLALVEEAMGQTDQARFHLEQAVQMKSNYDSARVELARLYRAHGNFEAARQQYEYILTVTSPGNETIEAALADLEAEAATTSTQTK